MSDRLAAAVAEMIAALRDELAEEIAAGIARTADAPPRLLSIPEAGEALGGVSRPTVYALIQSGRLRSITVNRRRFVPAAAVTEYLTGAEGRDQGSTPSRRTPSVA